VLGGGTLFFAASGEGEPKTESRRRRSPRVPSPWVPFPTRREGGGERLEGEKGRRGVPAPSERERERDRRVSASRPPLPSYAPSSLLPLPLLPLGESANLLSVGRTSQHCARGRRIERSASPSEVKAGAAPTPVDTAGKVSGMAEPEREEQTKREEVRTKALGRDR